MSARYRLAALALALFAVAAVSLQAAASEIRQKAVDWSIADVKPPPPVITEPASEGGRANPRDCPDGICDLEGTGPPNALVYVYRKLGGSLPIIGQPHGPRVDIARTDARGHWELPDVRLVEGDNVIVAIADVDGQRSEPSSPFFVTYSVANDSLIADVYGYNDCEPKWRGRVDTRGWAEQAHEMLSQAGYKSYLHTSDSAADAYNDLGRNRVFYFTGHGEPNGLQFTDGDCQSLRLSSSRVREVAEKDRDGINKWRLVVLVGCETAHDPSDSESILQAFWNQDRSAEMVIGFVHKTFPKAAEFWNKRFLHHAIEKQMEAGEAAKLAARETALSHWWLPMHLAGTILNEDSVVVLALHDVYLVPAENPGPKQAGVNEPQAGKLPGGFGDIGDWFEQWSTELGDRIRNWLDEQRSGLGQQITDWWEKQKAGLEEKGTDWWAEQKADLERKVTEWWEQQQEALARLLEEELERKVNELCGGSASIGLMIVVAVLSSHRQNRRRR